MFKVAKDISSTLKFTAKNDLKRAAEFVQEALKRVEGVAKVPLLVYCQDNAHFEKQFTEISQQLHDVFANNLNE